jgi:secreted trypsin-like serine protease
VTVETASSRPNHGRGVVELPAEPPRAVGRRTHADGRLGAVVGFVFFVVLALVAEGAAPARSARVPVGEPVPGVVALVAEAAPADDPYHGHLCGAVLVENGTILTAAHCVAERAPERLAVIVGADNLCRGRAVTGRRVGVVSVHVHPRYDPMTGRFDIAALGLAEEAVDTPRRAVRPEPTTMRVTAYGWGSTAEERPGSCRLERIPLRAAPGEGCPGLDGTGPRRFDAGSMLCVLPEGTSTTCFGDSGGPVVVGDDRDRRAPVVAIVSWAPRCGGPGADALASLWPF